MMKSFSIVVIAVVSIMVNSNAVLGETSLRMVFNNGVDDPNLSCNAEENALISSVFKEPMNRPRNLRSTNVGSAETPVDFIEIMDRSLQDHGLRYCRDVCKLAERCHHTGCQWYKGGRRLQHYGEGNLSNSTLCKTTASSINSDLDYMVSKRMVSSSCIALLKAPRKVECFEEVMFGIVEAFKVIASKADKVVIPFLHAKQDICGLKALNFEADVNPCVKSVNITLFNKDTGYRVSVVRNTTVPGPYTIFGMNQNAGDYKGQILAAGKYTIEATPDRDSSKMRDRTFFITAC